MRTFGGGIIVLLIGGLVQFLLALWELNNLNTNSMFDLDSIIHANNHIGHSTNAQNITNEIKGSSSNPQDPAILKSLPKKTFVKYKKVGDAVLKSGKILDILTNSQGNAVVKFSGFNSSTKKLLVWNVDFDKIEAVYVYPMRTNEQPNDTNVPIKPPIIKHPSSQPNTSQVVGSDEKMLSQIGSALMFPDNSQIATRLSALELAQAKTNEKIRRIIE
jgi:hypothetical protein